MTNDSVESPIVSLPSQKTPREVLRNASDSANRDATNPSLLRHPERSRFSGKHRRDVGHPF
jgi:hypothetical protein